MVVFRSEFSLIYPTGRRYPFFLLHWHPSKPQFEWSRVLNIFHSSQAVAISQSLMDGFVDLGTYRIVSTWSLSRDNHWRYHHKNDHVTCSSLIITRARYGDHVITIKWSRGNHQVNTWWPLNDHVGIISKLIPWIPSNDHVGIFPQSRTILSVRSRSG